MTHTPTPWRVEEGHSPGSFYIPQCSDSETVQDLATEMMMTDPDNLTEPLKDAMADLRVNGRISERDRAFIEFAVNHIEEALSIIAHLYYGFGNGITLDIDKDDDNLIALKVY
jgi:hypothetical protein